MTIIAGRDLTPGQSIEAEVCILGSGPAGLTLAAALSQGGRQVCVIESGGASPHEGIQDLSALECVGHPIRDQFIHRLRMLGGNSNLWAGRCMPLEPIDFAARDWVPASGWPVSFTEYLGFALEAARILRLPEWYADRIAAGAADPAPDLANAAFPLDQFSRKIALWAKRPANFWDLFGPGLKRGQHARIIAGLTVIGLRMSASGTRVEALRAVPSTGGSTCEVRARQFILALGGIENTRLLLLGLLDNPQARYPRAPLGRYYMDHPRALHGLIELNPGVELTHYLGRPVTGGMMQACLGLAFEQQRAWRCLNGYLYLEVARSELMEKGYDTTIQVMQRLLRRGHAGRRLDLSNLPTVRDLIYHVGPREVLPHDLYKLYFNLRTRMRLHRRTLMILNHCEQAPDPQSRITLGTEQDRFGNPVARLDWRLDPAETTTLVRLQQVLGAALEARGLGRLVSDPEALEPGMFTDASHHIGGTRMSGDSGTGVVDANLKVHDVENLFICGSSTFPTSGSANPTWSIVAFAIRLAAHLLGHAPVPAEINLRNPDPEAIGLEFGR